MFTRSILLPSLAVCAIAAPILFSQAKQGSTVDSPQSSSIQNGYATPGSSFLTASSVNGQFRSFPQSGSANYQTAPIGDPALHQTNTLGNPAQVPIPLNQQRMNYSAQSAVGTGLSTPSGSISDSMIVFPGTSQPPDMQFANMTPDYGATQTLIYPGNSTGPDLTAAPLEFLPVTNLEEIFRFDVSSEWIMSRWNRVSTSPGDSGLHGLRVALVTGTNSWDLHGSLTYFFDANQRPQRITFRGWAGDAKKLTEFLTQRYEFRTQPTQWAGFYLAKKRRKETGGILMQHPAVIYRENRVQQIAVVLEINNPQGEFALSDEFRSLIAGSQGTR